METCNNVTFRQRRMRRSLSRLSNESLDSLASNLSVKSMMDLSTHLKSDETLHLKNTIENLKEQLLRINFEIETLGLENVSLKQQLADQKIKTEYFKKMYITSQNPKSTTSSCNTGIYQKCFPNKNRLSARKLDLDIDFHTPEPACSSTVTDGLREENETKESNTKVAIATDCIAITHDKTEDKSQKLNLHDEGKSHKLSGQSRNGNILILSDDQGKGIVQGLLKKKKENRFILKNYAITGIRKPGATTEEVLLCCDKLSENFTKNDSVIIMTGRNDSNPIKFMAEMAAAVRLLKNCNIFIVNVKYNAFLNEHKLNYELKLLSQNYHNCNFIEANSYNSVIQQLLHKINDVEYYNKYLFYNNNVGTIGKPNGSEHFIHDTTKTSSLQVISTLEPVKGPPKGTIPYYFSKIVKPQMSPINTSIDNVVVSKEPFFRN